MLALLAAHSQQERSAEHTDSCQRAASHGCGSGGGALGRRGGGAGGGVGGLAGCSDSDDTLECLRGVELDTLVDAINQTPGVFAYQVENHISYLEQ